MIDDDEVLPSVPERLDTTSCALHSPITKPGQATSNGGSAISWRSGLVIYSLNDDLEAAGDNRWVPLQNNTRLTQLNSHS